MQSNFMAAGAVEECQPSKRIAFLTVPLSGHRRLAVSLAGEMATRGFPVDLLVGEQGVTDEMRSLAAERPNFVVHAITRGTEMISQMDFQRVASSTGRLGGSKYTLFQCIDDVSHDLEGMVEHWREMIEVLSVSRPDVVVLDHAHKVMQQWAEEQGIPTVILHTPYFQTGSPTGCARINPADGRRLDEFLQVSNPFMRLDKAKEMLGIAGQDINLGEGEEGAGAAHGLAPHTLVFCEPELLNTAHLPPRVHAVGPCLSDRDPVTVDAHLLPWLDAAAACGQKVLYVAFGTLANGFLTATAVGTLLDAFNGLGEGWRILWSLPQAQQPLLADSGRNLDGDRVRVEPFVRQRAVLAHPAVRVFLTHGGQSSVNEGIAAGRPLVCLPLFCDQYEMAESVRRHGLGLVFHKDELLEGGDRRLGCLISRVEDEQRFREKAGRHGWLMRIRGGCRRAAEVIESIAYAGAEFQELWEGKEEEAEGQAQQEKCSDSAVVVAPEVKVEAAAPAPARTLRQQPAAMVMSSSCLTLVALRTVPGG
uniref:UDP-glycosyltransferases domain-containing protein n=1 Tax=Alexandrium monilatum TaxID=311494 RepID=A0A7S4Q351_9DINO